MFRRISFAIIVCYLPTPQSTSSCTNSVGMSPVQHFFIPASCFHPFCSSIGDFTPSFLASSPPTPTCLFLFTLGGLGSLTVISIPRSLLVHRASHANQSPLHWVQPNEMPSTLHSSSCAAFIPSARKGRSESSTNVCLTRGKGGPISANGKPSCLAALARMPPEGSPAGNLDTHKCLSELQSLLAREGPSAPSRKVPPHSCCSLNMECDSNSLLICFLCLLLKRKSSTEKVSPELPHQALEKQQNHFKPLPRT